MAQLIIATILRWKEMRTPCNLLMMNRAKHRDRGPGSEFGNLLLLAHRGLHVKVPLSSARCLRVCVCVRCHSHNHSFGKVPCDSESDHEQDLCDHYKSSNLYHVV